MLSSSSFHSHRELVRPIAERLKIPPNHVFANRMLWWVPRPRNLGSPQRRRSTSTIIGSAVGGVSTAGRILKICLLCDKYLQQGVG